VEIRRTGFGHHHAQRVAANLAEELLERRGFEKSL
jgi:hypothetical protein